jgi:carbonic anhydrase
VVKTAEVQRSYINSGYPKVAGWVFDLAKGELIDLEINFEKRLEDIRDIYDLFGGASRI